jgi:hypothetical protein
VLSNKNMENQNTTPSVPPPEQDPAHPHVVVGQVTNPLRTFHYRKWFILGGGAFLFAAIIIVGYQPTITFIKTQYHNYMDDVSYDNPLAPPRAAQTPATVKKPAKKPETSAAKSTGTVTVKKTYCGVAGMPKQVCAIAKSVEANGLKGNPDVLAMTDNIPEGATIDLDFDTWKADGTDAGYMDGRATAFGVSKPGYLTFRLLSGGWKVTSVDLN